MSLPSAADEGCHDRMPHRYAAVMRTQPSRPLAVAAAIAAALWALFLLPPQQAAWSGAHSPNWLQALDDLPVYEAIRDWLRGLDQYDFYLVFGAAVAPSFLLIWLATGPTFAALGRSGRVLGWATLLGAPVTFISYLNHASNAPLRFMWGTEFLVLVFIGVCALVVAIRARRHGIPFWERILVGSTLPILVISTLALSYWPHGTLIGYSMEAAVLAAWGTRAAAAAPADRRPESAVA